MADESIALEGDRPASLLNFAEQMVKEAEKQAETIQQNAEAEAKKHGQKVVSDAVASAKAKSNEMLAKAERESQDLLKRFRKEADEILRAADLRAEDRLAASVSESQLQARQLATSIAEDIRSAVSKHLTGGNEVSPEASGGGPERNGKAATHASTKGNVKELRWLDDAAFFQEMFARIDKAVFLEQEKL